MKDALLNFGSITLSTANTYALAANVLDMGAVTKTGNLDNANVVVRFNAAPASGTVKIKVKTGTTSTPATVLLEASIAADGNKKVFAAPMPKEHQEFLGVEVSSPSTGSCSAAIEIGC